MTPEFDLCVIGCGPAGFAGAMRALDLGWRVCVVEGGEVGGAGVMWGALASKTMWELGRDYAIAAKTDRGYRVAGLTVDYCAVRASVLRAVAERQHQMRSQLESFSPRRWPGPGGITLKRGWGRFRDEHTLDISPGADTPAETIRARFFLVATGSTPRIIPHIPADQRRVLTSDGMLHLQCFPRRLVIVGAGIIGCEYATIFSDFRQTEVTLVDHASRVIPYEDRDVSDFVQASLERNGVRVAHSGRLHDIVHHPEYLDVILDFQDGHSQIVEADAVLVAIGRNVDLSRLNPEAAGIDWKGSGVLRTDADCRVRDHIYAAGDVTHHPSLVNIAEMEARHAVEHMFGLSPAPITYENMSTVMFFRPAVASVGLGEKACRRRRIPHRVAVMANRFCARALAMRDSDGFVKIIVTDDAEQRILGMRAAGPQVSSTIMSIAHFMDHGRGVRDVLRSIFPHPTISEGIQECLRLLQGTSLYKPHAFPEDLILRRWHPDDGDVEEDA